MLNTYTICYSDSTIMEYYATHLTRHEYKAIIDELIFSKDCTGSSHVTAKVLFNGHCICIFDLITWEDGSSTLSLDGRTIRRLNRKESKVVFS